MLTTETIARGEEHWRPGTVAIFACSGRDLFEEVPLPRTMREQIVVDAAPLCARCSRCSANITAAASS
jgi:hypothetical protein